jgi:hypothetical protein
MASNQRKYAIGTFRSCQRTMQAFDELRNIGFPMNKVSVLIKYPARDEQLGYTDTLGLTLTPAEGAAAGAVVGAAKGGLLALIVGLGILLVPGFGPALAAESFLITLLGSGVSAAAGGFIGALRGWFLPDEAAIFYNDQVSQGVYLVTVEGTRNEIRRAKAILTRWGIQEWCVYNTSANEAKR